MSNIRQNRSSSSFLAKVGALLRDTWALFELQSQLQLKAATSYARGPVRAPARRSPRI